MDRISQPTLTEPASSTSSRRSRTSGRKQRNILNARLIWHTLDLLVRISIANLFLLVALVIKPFDEPLAWRLACWTAESFWSYMQDHWENKLNARGCLRVAGDKIPKGESAVVISNHLSYSDYYLVQHLAAQAGMLGQCRYFVKKEIVWMIPVFGWAFWALGMILVSRNWTNDAKLVEQTFGRIKRNKHDIWVVLYPEGTRRTPRKLLQSQAFARQQGKAELQNLLFPRTKGFVSTIKGLRESHVKYVYDLTFLYTSPRPDVTRVPSLGDQISCANMAKDGYGFDVHVKRTAIADLPTDDDDLRQWCEDAWKAKDELLSRMNEERQAIFSKS